MGGFGSGRQWGEEAKQTTAQCPAIDVRRLQRGGLLLPGRSFPYEWTERGKKAASIHVTAYEDRIALAYDCVSTETGRQSERYSVLLEWLPCNYGGHRAWFRCPSSGCGCRVAILYGKGLFFACRHCHQLAYPSQRQLAYLRAIRRARAIRQRLGGTANLLAPFPVRPEGMHWKTYGRLYREYSNARAASYPGWVVRRAEKELAKA